MAAWASRYAQITARICDYEAVRTYRLKQWRKAQKEAPCSPDEAVALAKYRHTCDVLKAMEQRRWELLLEPPGTRDIFDDIG